MKRFALLFALLPILATGEAALAQVAGGGRAGAGAAAAGVAAAAKIGVAVAVAGATSENNNSGINITSLSGRVQLIKNGQVVMELTENDPLPTNLDSGITFKVLTGTMEIKAGNQIVTGSAGSEFAVAKTRGKTTVSSGSGTPVEVKDTAGNTYVLTERSAVSFSPVEQGVKVEVSQGRVLQSNTSGETSIIGSGESMVVDGPATTQQQTQTTAEQPKGEDTDADDTNKQPLMQDIVTEKPQTNVIPSKEDKESEAVVSRSTP